MSELDAAALIRKYRSKGVLVDSNLLVLFVVGLVNKHRIPQFKRTQSFTIEDYDRLSRLIRWFGKLISTPHVLAQVSDLADLKGKELLRVRHLFKSLVEQIEERHDPAAVLVTDSVFTRLGLTDAAISAICSRGILVLTADLQLHLALVSRGADAINFNYLRNFG